MTDAAVLHSMMGELGEEFITCLSYDDLFKTEHIRRVAEFVAPSAELAQDLVTIMSMNAKGREPEEAHVLSEDEEVMVARLQQKLDVIEKEHCGWS